MVETKHTSHALKHSIETSDKKANIIEFKIIDKNFNDKERKQKIDEVLWI